MTFLPIVQRDLLVACRQNQTYWSRVTTAGSAFLGIMWFLWSASVVFSPQRIGQQIFYTFTAMCFIFALGGGMHYTADCISSEKREGTIGFLFLTTLKGHDVVFGKLFGTSLRAVYGLLATLPVMSILMLLGGVTLGEFFRMALVLLNTLFLSLSVGLLCSCLLVEARKAAGWTARIMVVLALGTPAIGGLLLFYQGVGTMSTFRQFMPWFVVLSPVANCFLASEAYYVAWKPVFWTSFALIHLMAWGVLLLACRILPHRWQDRPATVAQITWRERWENLLQGKLAVRLALRRRLLNINPVHWLTSRKRMTAAQVCGTLAAMILLWLCGHLKFDWEWLGPTTFFPLAVMHWVTILWLSSEAVRQFAADRKTGALELLLGTPLELEKIFEGQILSLRRQFLVPVVLVLILDAVVLVALIAGGHTGGDQLNLICGMLAGLVVFLTDLHVLGWAGMWFSMTAKDARQASGNAIVRVLVLPSIIFQALAGLIGYVAMYLNFKLQLSFELLVILWVVLNLYMNIRLVRDTRKKLLAEFRELASVREPPGKAHQLWRTLGELFGGMNRRLRKATR